MSAPTSMKPFHQATRSWFGRAFDAPTPIQSEGWGHIARGEHALLIAPTGSGKTLAAFLWGIDRLGRMTDDAQPGVRVLYISPLKALAYDVERNLVAPLVGIGQAAVRLGAPFRTPEISVRTGDTPQKERQRFKRQPGDILVTTPESLYLLLGGQSREQLRAVHTVIVDEVHALAPTKRGAHLALSLERLDDLCVSPPQRIGLSATVQPPGEVAQFLAGARHVSIVDTSTAPNLDLAIVVPVRDLSRPTRSPREIEGLGKRPAPEGVSPASLGTEGERAGTEGEHDYGREGMGYGAFQESSPPRGIWAAVQPRILGLIQEHRSTIVFVNSRSLCERLARRLNELAGVGGESPLVRAHHGSVSHSQRQEIEEALKEGRLRGIVATSSLELGIDMGAVDLVIQVESPGSTARGLQRVGRAGHQVGAVSRARIFPKYPGDLLEAAVVAERMRRGDLEPICVPRNTLDVLAQQIVAMTSVKDWSLEHLEATVRRAYGFSDLSREALVAVLDMLSGRYPSTDFADLRPRLLWDRTTDVLSGRKGSKMLALQNAGTIPDRGLFTVHLGPSGPRVGELDEEMVHESRVGETFVLGASTWRVEEITRDRVIVSPAPGQPGRMPFWRGDGPGRPIELGRALGAFLRELDSRDPVEARVWLQSKVPLADFAADNLLSYVAEQKEATGTLPTDRAVTVERFRDELGDWRVCILTPFGARVHAPWALALEAALGDHVDFVVRAMWSDDGIVLRLADTGAEEMALPPLEALVPDPDSLEELVVEQVGGSPLFASLFRENAGRALLLPRRRVGKRTPLWAQRLKSQTLLAVAKRYPSFPIVLETYRQALQDHFDLPALTALLRKIRAREVKLEAVETATASPFARSLVYRYVSEYLYDGDTPAAERRAQALTLDRDLLRDLLGQEELRQLLDAGEMASLEDELQCLVEKRQARHPDALHDLLRRLGDLSDSEVLARCMPGSDVARWLRELSAARRVVLVRVAGEARWIAAEDAGLLRDGIGVVIPPGLPAAFLQSLPRPLPELLRRFARTHGPFRPDDAAVRLGVPIDALRPAAALLVDEGMLLTGAFRPGGAGEEWCAPEVLRTLRRRTLARLRGEVEPVEAPAFARFLLDWHGILPPDHRHGSGSLDRLRAVITQLEGLALPFGELETRIFPARVPGFVPRMLDELGAGGEVVWVGRGALGNANGKVALYRRARLAFLLFPTTGSLPAEKLHTEIVDHLTSHGASFASDLTLSCDPGVKRADIDDALWDLAWAGVVTNDTFGVLRARGGKARRGRRRVGSTGGRWSLVEKLRFKAPTDTERAHALANMLLERWGLVSREMMSTESLPGGFSSMYKVFGAMEEAGSVRRGWFCEGLTGAQFAFPGAVDRLRASRDRDQESEVRLVAASDPANPYGAALAWPPAPEGQSKTGGPRRISGATVVLVDGVLALWLGVSGKRLLTFPRADSPDLLPLALSALPLVARRTRKKAITVEKVDGEPALRSPRRTALIEAGFVQDYRGLTLEVD